MILLHIFIAAVPTLTPSVTRPNADKKFNLELVPFDDTSQSFSGCPSLSRLIAHSTGRFNSHSSGLISLVRQWAGEGGPVGHSGLLDAGQYMRRVHRFLRLPDCRVFP